MKKLIVLFCLLSYNAYAQEAVIICTNNIVNGTNVCVPVSTTNPLPTKSN